jgi:phosphohistidine phosphatase
MRTLSLLRHAKSAWDNPRLSDFERPLAPRGAAAAPRTGRHMREIGLRPDLVVCSPAVRTRETARLALAELAPPAPPVVFDEAIYEARSSTLMARLRALDGGVRHVLMIGHNPGLQSLLLSLAGAGLDGEHAGAAEKFPTAALAVLDLAIDDWPELRAGCGTLVHFATPRGLPGN